jgi:hypothetical protein
MTGVGPGAWGRVLASGSVERVTHDGPRETVEVAWEFTGSGIPTTKFEMRRTVWADDPHDLSSPLHYEVQLIEGLARATAEADRVEQRRNEVLEYITEHPASSTTAIERDLGRDARDYLFSLRQEGLADFEHGPRNARLWRTR